MMSIRMRSSLVLAAALLSTSAVLASSLLSPELLVNTMYGSNSRRAYSRGNVMPEVAMPWGFNAFAPMTDNTDNNWWFHADDVMFMGAMTLSGCTNPSRMRGAPPCV